MLKLCMQVLFGALVVPLYFSSEKIKVNKYTLRKKHLLTVFVPACACITYCKETGKQRHYFYSSRPAGCCVAQTL